MLTYVALLIPLVIAIFLAFKIRMQTEAHLHLHLTGLALYAGNGRKVMETIGGEFLHRVRGKSQGAGQSSYVVAFPA
jgi:hypothetical protein